jgi:methionyl aminopeptidase
MRAAARLARLALEKVSSCVKVGVTTDALDEVCHEFIVQQNAYPSPLNYAGFPKSLCTSINEVICHGIPDLRPLQFGDVISLDVSCFLQGVHGDNCATVICGDESSRNNECLADKDWRGVPMKQEFESPQEELRIKAARRLVQATEESLSAGIDACKPGGCLSHVGAAIHHVADAHGYESVQKYRGHGISTDFHCPPFVKVRFDLSLSSIASFLNLKLTDVDNNFLALSELRQVGVTAGNDFYD